MLYCPYYFWFFIEKCCTVPKKPKKPILQNLQAGEALLCLGTKNLGTVPHFCSSGLQKCCTVPKFFGKKPIGAEKCCTVPKKPKKPILQNLQAKYKNLGTVQHFCSPEE